MGFVIFVFLWVLFASAAGAGFAYVEGRVNDNPPRYKSAILLSVLLGIIGWIILAMRSGMTYSSGVRADVRAAARAADARRDGIDQQ
jgi:hydrogenase maturation factor